MENTSYKTTHLLHKNIEQNILHICKIMKDLKFHNNKI